jgi:hypothetical protein
MQECAHDMHIALELIVADGMAGMSDVRNAQLGYE